MANLGKENIERNTAIGNRSKLIIRFIWGS